MKTKPCLIATMMLATGLTWASEKVEPSQLPPPVKRALDTSRTDATVQRITMLQADGETVYDIDLVQKNSRPAQLRIAADGHILKDTTTAGVLAMPLADSDYGPTIVPVAPRLKFDDLPEPVRQTVQKESAGRPIASIERTARTGRAGYRITFRETGRNPDLEVAADGTLVKPLEKPPGVATLFMGMRFENTPPPVQQTIRREAAGGEIVKIDYGSQGGAAPTYIVDIKGPDGATYRVRIADTGQIFENTRGAGQPTGRN